MSQSGPSQAKAPTSWIWILTLFTAAGFVEAAFYSQINAFTPLYLPKIGVRPQDVATWTGAIASITSAIGLPLLPFWGALADRYARQPIIVRSFIAHFLAGLGMILSGSIWVFLLARSITSLALGNSGLMMTTLSERAPRTRQGLAFSIMNGGPAVGVFLGPLIGGAIFDAYGFRTLLAVNVVVMGLVIAAMVLGYRDYFVGTDRGPLLGMAVDSVRIVTGSPRLRLLFPALFLLFAGWLMALTFIPLVTTSVYRGPEPGKVVGLVAGAGGLGALLVSPLVGALADRRGHWTVLIAGGLVAIAVWPLPALARDLPESGLDLGAGQRRDLQQFRAVIQCALEFGQRRRPRPGDVVCLSAGQPGVYARPRPGRPVVTAQLASRLSGRGGPDRAGRRRADPGAPAAGRIRHSACLRPCGGTLKQ